MLMTRLGWDRAAFRPTSGLHLKWELKVRELNLALHSCFSELQPYISHFSSGLSQLYLPSFLVVVVEWNCQIGRA